jgi:hypothetical protein
MYELHQFDSLEMNAVELFHADGKSAAIYYCAICRNVAKTKDDADKCCQPYHCDTCGKVTERYHMRCSECQWEAIRKRDAERLEKATKLDGWEGPVFHPEISYNNGYFRNLEELLDWAECGEEATIFQNIKFVFLCNSFPFHADMDSMMNDACENMYEDFDADDLNGTIELMEAVEQFNEANKQFERWEPDYTRAIAVPVITTS